MKILCQLGYGQVYLGETIFLIFISIKFDFLSKRKRKEKDVGTTWWYRIIL